MGLDLHSVSLFARGRLQQNVLILVLNVLFVSVYECPPTVSLNDIASESKIGPLVVVSIEYALRMYFFATLFLQKVGESFGDDLPSHHDAFVAVVVARYIVKLGLEILNSM